MTKIPFALKFGVHINYHKNEYLWRPEGNPNDPGDYEDYLDSLLEVAIGKGKANSVLVYNATGCTHDESDTDFIYGLPIMKLNRAEHRYAGRINFSKEFVALWRAIRFYTWSGDNEPWEDPCNQITDLMQVKFRNAVNLIAAAHEQVVHSAPLTLELT